jgi:hypothetical protein
MPGPAVGIGSRVGSLGDGMVGQAAVGGWRRLIDGRADEGVAEGDPVSHGEEPFGFGWVSGVSADAKTFGHPPQQRRIAGRLGRGEQEQAPGGLQERRDPPLEALLDSASQRCGARDAEPAGPLRRSHPMGQLEQGQRVAAGLSTPSARATWKSCAVSAA